VQVKLLPTLEQARALEATLTACNALATSISVTAHEKRVTSAFELHHLTYHQSAGSGVSAQPRIRAIKKVADAYKTLRANLQAGSYGRAGSPKRAKVEGKPVVFRPDAAQPFDDRCLSWQHQGQTVSIWTTTGRMRGLTYTGLPAHLELLATHRRGESDLIRRGKNWFLIATVDLPDVAPADPTSGFVGVDLGIETSPSPTTRPPVNITTGPVRQSRTAATRTGCCGPSCRPRAPRARSGCSRPAPGKRRGSPPTSTTRFPKQSWPRPNAPDAESPSKI